MVDRASLAAIKLYVCLSTAGTLLTVLVQSPADVGRVLTFTLMAIAVSLGTVDAFINDLLPEEYSAPFALRWRYVIFIALAGGQTSLIYSAVIFDSVNFEVVRYAIDALAAAGAAVLDLRSRVRSGELGNHAGHALSRPAA